jgi:peptide/nickel transport system permease protein
MSSFDDKDLLPGGGSSPSATRAPRNWVASVALLFLALLVFVAVTGDWLAPHPPNEQDLTARRLPPIWAGSGTWSHPLGTDQLGRDVLSLLMEGTRLTLLLGTLAAGVELAIGAPLGVLAGYRGGRIEAIVMRATDIQMGFPALLLMLFVILVFGSSLLTVVLAVGFSGWMVFARLMRSEVRRIRNEAFVAAAAAAGMSGPRIAVRHVLPHIRGQLATTYVMEIPRTILIATGLSFLGLGIGPPSTDWGQVIGETRAILSVAYWPSLFAGLAIVLTVTSLYLVASAAENRGAKRSGARTR